MLTEAELDYLTQTFLFAHCDASEITLWAQETGWEKRSFAKNKVIFSPEHFSRALGILLSGRILVTKGELVVSELHPGELFGAAALFHREEQYAATLTARAGCQVLFLSQDAVQVLLERDGRIRTNYIQYLSQRIRFLSGKIDALTQGSGEKKLSSFLLRQMDEAGIVDTNCSMTELAQRLNMGRASLYRELQKLEDQGILTRSGKSILIRQPETLSRL